MSAPDFYFAINAITRHIHDRYGKEVLIDYWRSLGREYYQDRIERWKQGGPGEIARDWQDYFLHETGSEMSASATDDAAELDIRVCPAIRHMREHGRQIEPYFCEHCDHVCGSMAEAAGYSFTRTGGMGSCQQRFVQLQSHRE